MGPQSGSCGYRRLLYELSPAAKLQWVHSLVAVVMEMVLERRILPKELQWVHSLVAVVMAPQPG